MKPRASLFALSFSAGLLALSMTGCSSFPRQSATGPDAAKPVGGKAIELLQLRDHVKSTRLALNRTSDALNRVIAAPDTQEAYAAFSTELTAFKKLSAQTLKESGDVIKAGHVEAELGEVLNGAHPGRQSAEDIIIFKSLGMAVQDIAAADLVCRKLGI